MAFTFARRSVGRKIAVTVVSAVFCAVLIGSFAAAWRDAARQFELTQGQLSGIANATASTISEPLAAGRKRAVANALRGIGRIDDISFVRVFDANGKRVASFGSGVLLRRATPSTELLRLDDPFAFFSLSSYPVVVPVVHGGKTIGKLELIADISRLKSGFIEAITETLVIGLIAALVALLVSVRLQRTVTDPLKSLTRAMREISESESYETRVATRSIDETATLVSTFNGMLDEIQSRDQALRRHRDRLEDDVRARTRDLQAAKIEADEANAAKSDFLATMSHEIRTPMNGMMVMAELLAAGDLSPRHRRYSDVLLASGRSLLAIIDDILDISKIEAGKLELEYLPTEPAACIDDVVSLFAERAASRNLQLACIAAPDLPASVAVDPVRLNQVLSNLVSNALKFTETGGVTLHASVAETDGETAHIRFSVTDTGIGIPGDKLDAVFEAFTQAEQSTTRRFGGTGIGLAICKRLVTAMRGEIGVESELGTGTTFWFELPLRLTESGEPATASITVAAASPQQRPGEGKRVRIDLEPGPGREAVVALIEGLGASVIAPADTDTPPADLWIATANEMQTAATAIPHDAQPVRLAVVGFGDGAGGSLVSRGIADAVLESPLGTRQTRTTVAAALQGHEVLRALLADERKAARTSDRVVFEGVHVLAADDAAVNREVLSEVLGRLNVRVTCVGNGAEAVAALTQPDHGYDLVFMDGSMPEMDGTTATRLIREHEARAGLDAGNAIPIVALTAHVVGSAADAWYEAGASDYVSKPFKLATIQSCLAKHLPDKVIRQAADDAEDRHGDSVAGSGVGTFQAAEDAAKDAVAPLIDMDTLDTIEEMQPGGELVARVIALFKKTTPDALEAVQKAADDPAALASAAHALKSLCRSIGAARLGNACDDIETRARDGATLPPGEAEALALLLLETLTALSEPPVVDAAA
jgi:signal transduction histidine kinase/CheY-like chemotaxis protein/HPt (histidine-containing phosphotransfer) domain-containing protein